MELQDTILLIAKGFIIKKVSGLQFWDLITPKVKNDKNILDQEIK